MPKPKDWDRMKESKRARYLDTGQASRELEGLLSAGQIRDMAIKGEISGAIKVRSRVLIPRYALPSLVVELRPEPRALHRPPANTFDVGKAV